MSNMEKENCLSLTDGEDYRIDNNVLYILPGVDSIPDSCFCHRADFETIAFPDSLRSIGENAFSNCPRLKEVSFPDSLQSIGGEAFCGCGELRFALFPNGLEIIPNSCFSHCGKLESVSFGANLKKIGKSAFSECGALTDIAFPDGLERIGDQCFCGCGSLTKVLLLNNMKYVGDKAFADCSSLSEVETDGMRFVPFQMDVFENTPFLRRMRRKNPLVIIDNSLVDARSCKEKILLPDGLLQVSVGAFKGCMEVTEIIVPDSVVAIDYFAFQDCPNLRHVRLPQKLKYIGEYAFADCFSLEEVELPAECERVMGNAFDDTPWREKRTNGNKPLVIGGSLVDGRACKGVVHISGVEYVEHDAFRNNFDITEVVMEEGVRSIGSLAFENCLFLEKISLPKGLSYIGSCCFRSCRSLCRVTIPEGVEVLERDTFSDCLSLREVSIPNSLISVRKDVFWNCPNLIPVDFPDSVQVTLPSPSMKKSDLKLPLRIEARAKRRLAQSVIFERAYAYRDELVEVVIPEGVKVIEKEAFSMCVNLKEVVLPQSLISIEEGAFSHCAIESIVFPSALRSIGKQAFYFSGLKNAVFPDGLKSIGEEAFAYSKLNSVTLPKSVSEISFGAFRNCVHLREANVWCRPEKLEEALFSDCTRLMTFNSDCFPIEKNDFKHTPFLQREIAENEFFRITHGSLVKAKGNLPEVVEVPESVFHISSYAFENHREIVKVILPHSLRSIGVDAFCGCERLEEINFPNGLRTIGEGAFSKCGFKMVSWPEHLLSIPAGLFSECTSLREVVLPDTLKEIGSSAFMGCPIDNLVLPHSVESCENMLGLYSEYSSPNATLTILNDRIDINNCGIERSSRTFLWRGDVRRAKEFRLRCALLNDFCEGRESGFDYGDVVVRRNEQMIRDEYRGMSLPLRFIFLLLYYFFSIINKILFVLFYPIVCLVELGHFGDTNYKPRHFFDSFLVWLGGKLSHKEFFFWRMSDSMIRFLMRGKWLEKKDAERLLDNRERCRGEKLADVYLPYAHCVVVMVNHSDELYADLDRYVAGK